MTDGVLFVGPTLGVVEVEAAMAQWGLEVECLPPVSQGDVASLVRRRPRAMGIVDGYFDRVPAVWHKEILWAMSRGIHVFGAASMGALRAAELAAFGMVGVGPIFEAFVGGELTDDDEVAVAHADGAHDFRPLSVALVDMRATCAAAVGDGIIDEGSCHLLIEEAKSLFYPLRDYPVVLTAAVAAGLPKAQAEALKAWLPTGRVEQKRLDAEAMLKVMGETLRRPRQDKEVKYFFNATSTWQDLERSLVEQRPLDRRAGAETLPEGALLDELRLLGEPYRSLRHQALVRVLALEVADLHRLEASGGNDDGRVAQIRHFAAEHLPPHMLKLLRRDGQLKTLRRRARRKEEVLARSGRSRVELEGQGPDDEELWCWYFDTLLEEAPPSDLDAYARDHDFTDVAELRWTVLREFLAQEIADSEIPSLQATLEEIWDKGKTGQRRW